MHNSRTKLTWIALTAAFVLLQAAEAGAIRYQPRPNWTAGVGFGVGQGEFENVEGTFFYKVDGETSHYKAGVSPVIHLGRMLGEHFQVGVSYEAWLAEFGNVEIDTTVPDKWRRTMQNLSVAFAVFPGNQRGASGGIFLRVGAGLGWVGTGAKEVFEDEAQTEGEREDDWGWAAFGEGGYEFWVHSNASAGLSATFNYFDVSGDHFVSKAWFASIVMNFNVYW
jgi:hypothetical protein